MVEYVLGTERPDLAERLAGMTVRIHGKLFATQAEAARELGLSRRSICRALAEGREDRVGMDYPGPRAIVYDGVRYESIATAARKTGIKRSTMYAALHNKQKTCHRLPIRYD